MGSLLRRVLVTELPAEAVAGDAGRVLLRPWALSPEEYIEHGLDQLRHAAPSQPLVAATLLRVLRMLVAHVEQAGRPEHVPALRRQVTLLLDALRAAPDLHTEDLRRLEAMATDAADPADHSAGWVPAEPETPGNRPMNGHR